MGLGGNLDAGLGFVGASATGGVGAGGFVSSSGSVSGGGFVSGGAAANAGSTAVGLPKQTSNTVFVLGGYVGAGLNIFGTNAGSVKSLSGPFTTVSINVGYSVANFGFQISFGGGIWSFSITPPIASVGYGVAGSVITTNTATTSSGCN